MPAHTVLFCAATRGWYPTKASVPNDCHSVEVPHSDYLSLLGHPVVGDANGYPVLEELNTQPSAEQLCSAIDAAADAARRAVAGDPLRAVEYDRAASEAQTFATANYQGAVPPMVAAWAINGRTARQAADGILQEAAHYNAALVQLRTMRLNAKELIRNAMTAGNVEQAQDIADETIASIQAAVAGIGNNAGV
ncbi:phage tail protein [Pseudomonas anguilliseptica]|uniref:Phage tail protein n=1 Tax=Pseudomonas anguilliseptica TaxID=53406 RepID=A0A1H5DD55_PSEAG|nr:phage tail protein [Pseudomonas anguilliseptica]SED76738.1 hypothetical protein SAMN05421553_3287 [Pseudomonas anguilliseptica]SED78444.1 hypothetical protein SAMN05421553_3328 [Pseudomonas anguilliseptica]